MEEEEQVMGNGKRMGLMVNKGVYLITVVERWLGWEEDSFFFFGYGMYYVYYTRSGVFLHLLSLEQCTFEERTGIVAKG